MRLSGVRMPPSVTNKTLKPEQIEVLRRWIAEGAEYKPHWAYISPQKPLVPRVIAAGRTLTEIERFVMQRLQREGLTLSPDADKETLINRVTLILTGLPPTLADVDAFLEDTSPNAYEKVVDRLLASPAYGEHMAAYWGDLSRYSESDGFLDDYHDRLLWPYRDWMIAAFNRNMPFDQFGTWQIAGDLLPGRTATQKREQTLATAFLRVGKRTTENGAIDEEYRVEYAVDRTNTIGTAFLGMTVGCARCHDHKYDPISQKDFYSLSGFFNSTDEPGFYAPGRTGITAGPTLPWTDAETDRKIAAAEARMAEKEKAHTAAVAIARRDAAAKAAGLVSARPRRRASCGSRCRRRSWRITRLKRSSRSPMRSCRGRSPGTAGGAATGRARDGVRVSCSDLRRQPRRRQRPPPHRSRPHPQRLVRRRPPAAIRDQPCRRRAI